MFTNIKKGTKRLLYFIAGLNILVLLLCLSLFLLNKKKNDSITQIIDEIQEEYVKIEEAGAIKDLLKDTKEDRERINTYFVSKDGVVDFIERIENLGDYADISLVLNSVDISSGESPTLSMSVSAVGDWEDVLYFLALVESMPVNMSINSARLTKAATLETGAKKRKGAKANKAWNGSFSFRVYSFVEKL